MTDFERAFEIIIGVEGGYGNDPKDRGNWTGGAIGQGKLSGTKFGISAAAYPEVDIKSLPKQDAMEIYMRDYWDECECDKLPWPVNLIVFDGAVQHGTKTMIKLLQRAVKVTEDGYFGERSERAVNFYKPKELAALLCSTRIFHYQKLSGWQIYGRGWVNRMFTVALAG
jgi:lysozyme family protein